MILIIIITIIIIKNNNNTINDKMTKHIKDSHSTQYRALCDIQQPKTANLTKSPTSDAAWVIYAPLKRFIYHLTWWIGVDHAAWIPCLELSPTWFLKITHNEKKKGKRTKKITTTTTRIKRQRYKKKIDERPPLSRYYKWQACNLFFISKTFHRHPFR